MATGIVPDLRRCVTTDLKATGDPIYLVGETKDEMGGSEYYRRLKGYTSVVPSVDPAALKASVDGLLRAMAAGTVRACHDISHGGLAVAAVEMAFGGLTGARIRLEDAEGALRPDFQLFSESNGRWLVEVAKDRTEAFESAMAGVPVQRVGEVGGFDVFFLEGKRKLPVPLTSARERWDRAIPRMVGGLT